jgi:saccharopine dehydrogenase (NAD+, L-lysine-forming)
MKTNKLFIRKECRDNEFRAPIVPSDVKKLIDYGFEVIVESSDYRCFCDEEYENNGAIITHDTWEHYNDCLIIGIKELDDLKKLNNHTHVFFSHSY